MCIHSFVLKGREKVGKRTTIKRLDCSAIEVETLKKLKARTMMKSIQLKTHQIKAMKMINSKQVLSPRKHFQWLLMIKLCLLPLKN